MRFILHALYGLVKFNPCGKIEVNGNEITFCLKSRPERGKANKELVEGLASYFEVPKTLCYGFKIALTVRY